MATTAAVKRSVITNAKGYKEVALEFRVARAKALEAGNVHKRTDRIHCPALDASRSSATYGAKALPSTDKAGLDQWADGLGLPKSTVSSLAYASGPWYKYLSNKRNETFDETEVNTGFIKSLKKEVHTGILSAGAFDQDVFNEFVWTVHPDLKGTAMDNSFLHSNAADDVYIGSENLEVIMEHNKGKSDAFFTGLGPSLSKFEMEKFILGLLGQKMCLAPPGSSSSSEENNKPDKEAGAINVISVRDMHDLYKYGVFPAVLEDQFLQTGLIPALSIAMSGETEVEVEAEAAPASL